MLTAAALPVLAAVTLALRPASQDLPASIDLTALAASAEPVSAGGDEPRSVEVTVQRNDTLDRIFRAAGVDNTTLTELRRLPDARKALDLLRPGDIITLTHVDGALQSLNRRISNTLTLSVARAEQGFAVNYIENPLETEVAATRARIDSSLFAAGREAGLSGETIMVLANEMFGWDIDFALDIRRGDEFSVIYQRKFQDGRYVGDGRVLAAEFVNQGRTYRAAWFESADGAVRGYFTPGAAACARPSCAPRSTSLASARASTRGACTRSAAGSVPTRAPITPRRPARRSGRPATVACSSRAARAATATPSSSTTVAASRRCTRTCRASAGLAATVAPCSRAR